MLTRGLARELGNHNVRVNAIAPWNIITAMSDWLSDPEATRTRLAMVPMGRFAETDDIVGAALFLASDAASWITGHTLVVDGGFLA